MTIVLLAVAAFGTFYGVPAVLLFLAFQKGRREKQLREHYSRADYELHKYRRELRKERRRLKKQIENFKKNNQ